MEQTIDDIISEMNASFSTSSWKDANSHLDTAMRLAIEAAPTDTRKGDAARLVLYAGKLDMPGIRAQLERVLS